jgi:hypothetical protein
MASATHRGHCQACGRLQMLPKGVLSIHGYKVTYGYFSGICAGTKALPFELSCELVKTFIVSAKAALVSVEATQAALRAPATEPKAWQHVGHKDSRGRYVYAWELVTIVQTFTPYADGGSDGGPGGYLTYTFTDSYGKVHGDRGGSLYGVAAYELPGATHADRLLATCTKFNTSKATWLEHEAKSLRSYIKWQTARVASWKLAPLFPVTYSDKEGFKTEAAPY